MYWNGTEVTISGQLAIEHCFLSSALSIMKFSGNNEIPIVRCFHS